MSVEVRRVPGALVLAVAVLAVSSLTCAYYSGVPEFDQEEGSQVENPPAPGQREAEERLADLALTQTAIAEILATRAAAPSPEGPTATLPPSSHVPVITDIDFPAVASLNVRADGMITFTDPAQDVNRMTLQTLEGTFPSGSQDATKDITWAGDEGRLPLAGICGRQEFVKSTITLRDAAGNVSEGYTFSFYCQ